MSDNVQVTWHGDLIKQRAKALIGKSAWTIGLAVLRDAKLLCPVDKGWLAASLNARSSTQTTEMGSPTGANLGAQPATFKRIDAPGGFEKEGQVLVGTAVEYGPHREFGTVLVDAQPFLRPALDMAQGKVPAIVKADAKQEFGEYLK